jgi:hypothetical protein
MFLLDLLFSTALTPIIGANSVLPAREGHHEAQRVVYRTHIPCGGAVTFTLLQHIHLQVARHLEQHERKMDASFREWLAAADAAAAATRNAERAQAREERLEALAERLRAANEAAVREWFKGKAKRKTLGLSPSPPTKSTSPKICGQGQQLEGVRLDHVQGEGVARGAEEEEEEEEEEEDGMRVSVLRQVHLQKMVELQQPKSRNSRQRPWNNRPLFQHKRRVHLFSLPAQIKLGGVLQQRLYDLEPHQQPPALAFY